MASDMFGLFGPFDLFARAIPGATLVVGAIFVLPSESALAQPDALGNPLVVLLVSALLGIVLGEAIHSLFGFVEKGLTTDGDPSKRWVVDHRTHFAAVALRYYQNCNYSSEYKWMYDKFAAICRVEFGIHVDSPDFKRLSPRDQLDELRGLYIMIASRLTNSGDWRFDRFELLFFFSRSMTGVFLSISFLWLLSFLISVEISAYRPLWQVVIQDLGVTLVFLIFPLVFTSLFYASMQSYKEHMAHYLVADFISLVHKSERPVTYPYAS